MRSGEASAVQYAEEVIERIESDGALNALIGFDPSRYIAAARASDQERARGGSFSPLHGLPIVVKDNIDVAGWPTTCNSPALLDNLVDSQGPVVAALLDAGAIVMAKANMHELAMGPGVGDPPPGDPPPGDPPPGDPPPGDPPPPPTP